MARIKWSIELLQAAANEFSNRTDFARGNPSAYSAAAKRKVLDQICGHMIAKQAPRYTDDQLRETAARYQHVGDFREAHASMYAAIQSRGLKHFTAHMTARPFSFPNRGPRTPKYPIEEMRKVALRYDDLKTFRESEPKIYSNLMDRGLADEFCAHMKLRRPRKITHELYANSLPETIEVLEKVESVTTKYLHRCKVCEHEWWTKPANIRSGRGCPICNLQIGRKKLSAVKRYTADQYAARVPHLEVLEPYQGVHVKILHRCKQCGNEWRTKPSVALRNGCRRRCTPIADYTQQLKARFGDKIHIIGHWINSTVPTEHICDKNHHFTVSPKDLLRMHGCTRCNWYGTSPSENNIADWIEAQGFVIRRGDRTLIRPKEIDIYVPDHNVAIEFNGSYWHSHHSADYHLNKTKLCEQQGIRLIHVWEYEADSPIMRSVIRAAIGSFDHTIQARQCCVERIEWSDAAAFLNANHIQGAGAPSPHNLALTYDGEIVAIMTFGKPRFKPIEHDWELIRYATALNTRIVGGAARLWSRRPAGSVVTYSDRRLFDGRLYARLGFERQRESKPGYFYTNREGSVLRRWDTRREKLPALLGERFDPTLSEAENMQAAGWHKIWDCGTVTWSYRPAPSS